MVAWISHARHTVSLSIARSAPGRLKWRKHFEGTFVWRIDWRIRDCDGLTATTCLLDDSDMSSVVVGYISEVVVSRDYCVALLVFKADAGFVRQTKEASDGLYNGLRLIMWLDMDSKRKSVILFSLGGHYKPEEDNLALIRGSCVEVVVSIRIYPTPKVHLPAVSVFPLERVFDSCIALDRRVV